MLFINIGSRHFVFLLLLLFFFPITIQASWEDLGLYGGQVYDIAIDPTNPSKMFAGTYYGGGFL